jgi:glycosyltransferase involved in cell wall biosynthesis
MSSGGLRVAHLTSDHFALDPRIFYKECRSLARAGYQVTLIGRYPHDAEIDGVKIKAIRFPPARWFRLSAGLALIWSAAAKADAEIYHLHDPELLPIGLWLRRRGKKVIYDVHDDFPALASATRYLPFPGPFRGIPASVIRYLENSVAPKLSAIIAAVEFIGARFEALNSNCVVVHNLPEPDELAPRVWPRWNERSPNVAYVGTFARWRGVREMVLAMGRLPKSLDSRLLLVGRLPSDLHADIARLPGYDRVQVLGVLDRSGVRQILRTVTAGLVLLHPVPFMLGAWPLKMFEYMAAGLPVIASDFPLWREFLGDPPCGMLVNPLDPGAIADAIEFVLTHPAEAEEMGSRGHRNVEERFNWTIEERKLLQLYHRLETGAA